MISPINPNTRPTIMSRLKLLPPTVFVANTPHKIKHADEMVFKTKDEIDAFSDLNQQKSKQKITLNAAKIILPIIKPPIR